MIFFSWLLLCAVAGAVTIPLASYVHKRRKYVKAKKWTGQWGLFVVPQKRNLEGDALQREFHLNDHTLHKEYWIPYPTRENMIPIRFKSKEDAADFGKLVADHDKFKEMPYVLSPSELATLSWFDQIARRLQK